jgi:hypothetical protein
MPGATAWRCLRSAACVGVGDVQKVDLVAFAHFVAVAAAHLVKQEAGALSLALGSSLSSWCPARSALS